MAAAIQCVRLSGPRACPLPSYYQNVLGEGEPSIYLRAGESRCLRGLAASSGDSLDSHPPSAQKPSRWKLA